MLISACLEDSAKGMVSDPEMDWSILHTVFD